MAFGTDYTPVGPMPTDIVLGDVDATSMRLARDIRDKGHGIDTRETMARMILKSSTMHNHLIKVNNALKVQNDEYYRQFTDVMKELSEDKDYYSLPEIAGARGGFNTLGERLAQTVNKGNVNINDFDDATRQAFLDAQGIDVNYVLGSGNVKPINMSIIRIAGNIFNPSNVTAGKLINSSGNLATSASYNASDFIQVMVGRNHTFRNIRNFAKYDMEGNFVEFVDLVAGSNVSTQFMDQPLIRTSIHENYLSSATIEEGEDTSDGGPMRSVIPSGFIEKENYPAFVRYKDGVLPYITDRIYSAVRSISLQGFEIDKTYKLRFISRNNSTHGYRFIIAVLNEDGTWSDYFDSGSISISENTGRLTTVEANDNGKSVIMKVAYNLIPNNYASHTEGSDWATADPFHVINSSGMGGGNSSFNQSLNTTDSPTFEEVITTGVLPTGTLANPPAGLVTGDTWADTTDSTTHPILRVKL